MRPIEPQAVAMAAISLLLMSCTTLHTPSNRKSIDYNTFSALKPGISTLEVRDLLNGPNDLYAGGFESGLTSAIWFFNQKALPDKPLKLRANIVFTFSHENLGGTSWRGKDQEKASAPSQD